MAIVIGTRSGDTIETGDSNDIIISRGGNDYIISGDGDDIIIAGSGDDVIDAGAGDDFVVAGSGDDTVNGGSGDDFLLGGSGNDLMNGDDDDDVIFGNNNNDTVTGGSGNDIVIAGSGDDLATYNVDDNINNWDYYDGGSGNDTLRITINDTTLDDLGITAQDIENFFNTSNSWIIDFSDLGFELYARKFENIEIEVIDTNQPPVAVDDNVVTDEDSALVIDALANDTDPDIGDLLIVSNFDATSALGLTITLNPDDTFSYDPSGLFDSLNVGDSVLDSFSYTISDGVEQSTATVNVTINGVNDAPEIANTQIDQNVLEGEKLVLTQAAILALLAASDIDNNTADLQVNITDNDANGSVVQLGDGSYEFSADDPDFFGTLNFAVAVSDPGGASSAAANLTVDIASVNDAPTFTAGGDQSINAASGAQLVAGWATNISEGPANEAGQNLTFNLTTDNDAAIVSLSLDATTGDLTYELVQNFVGEVNVSVTLADDGGTANGGSDTSASSSFKITANPVTVGTDGNDILVGSDAGELFTPELGLDTIFANGGDDTIFYSSNTQFADADFIDGGAGVDTVVFDATAIEYGLIAALLLISNITSYLGAGQFNVLLQESFQGVDLNGDSVIGASGVEPLRFADTNEIIPQVSQTVSDLNIGALAARYYLGHEQQEVIDFSELQFPLDSSANEIFDINTQLKDVEVVSFVFKSDPDFTDLITSDYYLGSNDDNSYLSIATDGAVLIGRGGDDELAAFAVNSIFQGGAGNDTISLIGIGNIIGLGNNNSIIFGIGDGQDTVEGFNLTPVTESVPTDVIQLDVDDIGSSGLNEGEEYSIVTGQVGGVPFYELRLLDTSGNETGDSIRLLNTQVTAGVNDVAVAFANRVFTDGNDTVDFNTPSTILTDIVSLVTGANFTAQLNDAGAGDDVVQLANRASLLQPNNTLFTAGAGNDTVTTSDQDDRIDGGADTDTVVYHGNFADYNISVDATSGNLIVEDIVGTDGIDELSNVEFLDFADITAVDTSTFI